MRRATWLPIVGALAVAGVAWWLTRPKGTVTMGPLIQPGYRPPDAESVVGGSAVAGGLELAPIAADRPENLSGSFYSNAEVDAILNEAGITKVTRSTY